MNPPKNKNAWLSHLYCGFMHLKQYNTNQSLWPTEWRPIDVCLPTDFDKMSSTDRLQIVGATFGGYHIVNFIKNSADCGSIIGRVSPWFKQYLFRKVNVFSFEQRFSVGSSNKIRNLIWASPFVSLMTETPANQRMGQWKLIDGVTNSISYSPCTDDFYISILPYILHPASYIQHPASNIKSLSNPILSYPIQQKHFYKIIKIRLYQSKQKYNAHQR